MILPEHVTESICEHLFCFTYSPSPLPADASELLLIPSMGPMVLGLHVRLRGLVQHWVWSWFVDSMKEPPSPIVYHHWSLGSDDEPAATLGQVIKCNR